MVNWEGEEKTFEAAALFFAQFDLNFSTGLSQNIILVKGGLEVDIRA